MPRKIFFNKQRRQNEKNLKIHKTKQKKHLQIAHSLSHPLSLTLSIYLFSLPTGMCCNSRSALVQSVLPAKHQHCPSSFFVLCCFCFFFCLFAQMRELFIFPIFSGEIPCGNALINAVACCSVEHMSAICKSNAQASQPTMAECSVVKPEHPLSSLPLLHPPLYHPVFT